MASPVATSHSLAVVSEDAAPQGHAHKQEQGVGRGQNEHKREQGVGGDDEMSRSKSRARGGDETSTSDNRGWAGGREGDETG